MRSEWIAAGFGCSSAANPTRKSGGLDVWRIIKRRGFVRAIATRGPSELRCVPGLGGSGAQWWGQQQKRCVMTVHQMVEKDQQFVSVTGVIHLHTSISVFLDVGERRVFVPQFSYLDFTSPLCGR